MTTRDRILETALDLFGTRGVDAVSLGTTKNGGLSAEAIVVFAEVAAELEQSSLRDLIRGRIRLAQGDARGAGALDGEHDMRGRFVGTELAGHLRDERHRVLGRAARKGQGRCHTADSVCEETACEDN